MSRKILYVGILLVFGQVESFFLTKHEECFSLRISVGMKPSQRAFGNSEHKMPTLSRTCSTVFNFNQRAFTSGVDHRYSASDWLYNVFSLPKSCVLRETLNPVLTITVWSTVVSVIHHIFSKSSNRLLQSIGSFICVSSTPHQFLVNSLGLLLVFRTNSAYQRFYEGRKIWEDILSISRNLSRMTSFYENEIGRSRKHRLLNLLASFPYLLKYHVRSGCLCDTFKGANIPKEFALKLKDPSIEMVETRHEGDKHSVGGTTRLQLFQTAPKRECWVDKRTVPWNLIQNEKSLKQVAIAENRPLWVCDRVAREIVDIPYGSNFSSRERLKFLGDVSKLTATVGQCERIHQTAVPLNYARHSLRALSLWLLTLPFTLVKDIGFLTPVAMAFVSWLLFGVYQIGYSIEDPFQGSLRLSTLCDAIRRDILREATFENKKELLQKGHGRPSLEMQDVFIPNPNLIDFPSSLAQSRNSSLKEAFT